MITVKEAIRLSQGREAKEQLIRHRITGAMEYWAPYKKRVSQYTSLVMGDHGILDGSPAMGKGHPDAHRKVFAPDGVPEKMVTMGYDRGTTNAIREQFWTIVARTSYRMPEIGFEGLDPIEATINKEYLKKILRPEAQPASADGAMQKALMQRIIGGLGWIGVLARDGAPFVRHLDVVSDIVWDPEADTPEEASWSAICTTAPLSEWAEIYAEWPGSSGHFDDLLRSHSKNPSIGLDQPVEMIEYFDVNGRHAIFRSDRLKSAEAMLVLEESPFFVETPHERLFFLPTVPHRHIQVPRAMAPVSMVEQMAPYQAAIRRAEVAVDDHVGRFGPWIDVPVGSYDDEQLDKIGKQGAMAMRRDGTQPAAIVPGAPLSGSLIQALDRAKAGLVAAGGSDPYALGQTTSVQFSSEVRAIQANSGLATSVVSEDYSRHYRWTSYFALALGKAYDKRRIQMNVNGVTLQWDATDPIGEYLRLTDDVVVAPSSAAYEDPDTKINRYWNLIQMGLQLGGIAPQMARIYTEKLLAAEGERDIQRHFEAPQSLQEQAGMTEANLQ
jgi:hypothetical protein